ncbi:MAG: hypothetical protein QXT93_10570 [Thermofilum sp.]
MLGGACIAERDAGVAVAKCKSGLAGVLLVFSMLDGTPVPGVSSLKASGIR